jgi:diguanylate cyclase (GGDEF)-like protein
LSDVIEEGASLPEFVADPPAPAPVDPHDPTARRPLRPEFEVLGFALAMALLSLGLMFVIPDADEAIRPTGWWAMVTVVVLFGLFEYVVFNVEFREDAISFSLSEIPTALALVFLSPAEALLARLPISLLVLLVVRRNAPYKLAFNISMFAAELLLSIELFRVLTEWWGGSDAAAIAAVAVSLMLIVPLSSVMISVAIGRFEGHTLERIGDELRATWWMYSVNCVLAAMTVALALIDPPLALLAVLPAAGMWYVLHSHGALGQQLRDLDAVHGFAGRVSTSLRPAEIADTAVSEIVRLLRAESVALVRFGDDGSAAWHLSGPVPLRLPDRRDSPEWSRLLEATDVELVESASLPSVAGMPSVSAKAIVVPVRTEVGAIALLVVLERENPAYHFDAHDLARARHLGEQLATSLSKGMLHERIEFEARHDALTGLPGRTLFESIAAEVVRNPRPTGVSCVLMLDLDRFKEVNDTLGHHAGDDLLVQFASRMSALLEPGDVLARLAGDEFAILCHRADHESAIEFARTCADVGSRPVMLDGLEIVVTVSVGVAQITPVDRDALQPMRRADIAMYNAKWQRSGVEHYRDEIDRRTPARLSMLGDLRAAIASEGLDVVYQPKLDLASGRVVGAEALVRWQHQSRGVVAPAEFVRVAEDTGLIKELTDLVLATGIAMLRRFDEHGLDIGLAVNLSTHDLFDSRLPDRVRGYLERNGVSADALTLEITESSLLIDAPRTRSTIDELHAVGLRLAIDDFGTGYSSLSYLRRLPVHELKVDQSFVSGMLDDPHDEVIVRSTIDLGHNLGLRIVAEGVETIPTLDRLTLFGCDVAQGYVISSPLSGEDLIAWVSKAESARRSGVRLGASPTAWVAGPAQSPVP